MPVSETDQRLLAATEEGLPLDPHPYREIGRTCGLDEAGIIARLKALMDKGIVKRLGLVVRHHELGFAANAMVVWDIPDGAVTDIGRRMSAFPFVTLCYRRLRRPPRWPYNLFCMIHGRDRGTVFAQIEELKRGLGLSDAPCAVLFSGRRFKQRGARYPAAKEIA